MKSTRVFFAFALTVVASAFVISGCGDGNNDDIFVGETPTPASTPVDGRTATPVRTATPQGGETATPVETATVAVNPTATATPGGPTCQSGDQFTVTVSLDKPYGAARVDVTYPASLNIPGSGSGSDVKGRVAFTSTGGVTAVNDQDTNGDGSDDTLTASFAGTDDVAAGMFITATFDCVAGSPEPSSGSVTCTVVSASTGGGTAITDEQCSVVVAAK